MNDMKRAVFAAAYGAAYAQVREPQRERLWKHEAAKEAARIAWDAVEHMNAALDELPLSAQEALGHRESRFIGGPA